jgi:Plasmid encoded RepA protein
MFESYGIYLWKCRIKSGSVTVMADSSNDNPQDPAQKSLADVLVNLPAVRAAKKANTLSRVHRRVIEPIESDQDNDPRLAFQHTVFCQAGLPYRNPGDDVRQWQREQGAVSLLIKAGEAMHPSTRKWVELGLPWGTKPRLILAHLNAEALRQGSPVIEVENSLSAFVKRIRGFNGGREIRAFKDQLSRLSVAVVRLATTRGDRAFQINSQVVTAFELWPELDARQRVLWPSTIQLSLDYFASLQEHAVPLNEADLAALAHSAMALDIYSWLAQRLHRVNPSRPAFIQWPALKQQFGLDYARMSHFKPKFRIALRQVLTRYKAARIDLDSGGMRLHHSPPPVTKRLVMLPPKTSG